MEGAPSVMSATDTGSGSITVITSGAHWPLSAMSRVIRMAEPASRLPSVAMTTGRAVTGFALVAAVVALAGESRREPLDALGVRFACERRVLIDMGNSLSGLHRVRVWQRGRGVRMAAARHAATDAIERQPRETEANEAGREIRDRGVPGELVAQQRAHELSEGHANRDGCGQAERAGREQI